MRYRNYNKKRDGELISWLEYDAADIFYSPKSRLFFWVDESYDVRTGHKTIDEAQAEIQLYCLGYLYNSNDVDKLVKEAIERR